MRVKCGVFLRGKNTLTVVENKMRRRMFGHSWEEATGG